MQSFWEHTSPPGACCTSLSCLPCWTVATAWNDENVPTWALRRLPQASVARLSRLLASEDAGAVSPLPSEDAAGMPEIPAPVHGEGLSKVGPPPTDEEDVTCLAARVAWRDGDVMHALSRYRLDADVLLARSRLVAAVPALFFSGRRNGCFVHRLSGRGAADPNVMGSCDDLLFRVLLFKLRNCANHYQRRQFCMREKGLARDSAINNIMFSHMHAVETGITK